MTVARSVADVLTEHVLFEIDCVDRMYCNVYVPQLQFARGLVGSVHRQLGLPIASTAPLARHQRGVRQGGALLCPRSWLAKAGLAFDALDNGFAAVDDPAALQDICDGLGPQQIDALLRKWQAILPHPFSPGDRAAGYCYDISILQAESSLTQMLDKSVAGRVFFEQVIRDNLDIGRPDQVALVFDRKLIRRGPRHTPGSFRTRVITEGVTPSLYVDYKHTRIKQYHNCDARSHAMSDYADWRVSRC
jgi:hypothetical protein